MTLDDTIADYERRGYRLDMIMPADAPRIAIVSKGSEMLRLVATAAGIEASQFTGLGHPVIPPGSQEFVVSRTADAGAWHTGRAGMQYRDLIPSRLGGRYIASHIRIPDGGPVNDYVHHHRIRFQMIFVLKGWVRVVYEDQGAPFVMHEGDCVLQPPGIRHRVLEASPGLEVLEIGSPAEHETFRDHELALPTPASNPSRNFSGQRFVRHVAAEASWQTADGITHQDTGIAKATNGLAAARIIRLSAKRQLEHAGDFYFLAVLNGATQMQSAWGRVTLEPGDTCVLPTGTKFTLDPQGTSDILEVTL